jgi:hypothetical protein
MLQVVRASYLRLIRGRLQRKRLRSVPFDDPPQHRISESRGSFLPTEEVHGHPSNSHSPVVVARLAAFAKASARQQNKRPSYPAQAGDGVTFEVQRLI